jgi:V/A-type H+-transporting ATPase subunit I
LLLVVVGGGRSPASSLRGLIRRIGEGLLELRNVTQLFGDVMSYLRLFALGLAGSSLAMTFNELAAQVRDGVPGAGLLLSVVLLVVGHGINLLLAVVGGTVHGLRLNYIEFLHWSVAGDGYPFRPFRAREVV